MSPVADPSSRAMRGLAIVVVPCLLTGAAFAVLRRFDAVGNIPLWVILLLLALGGVMGAGLGPLIQRDARPIVVHLALASEILGVTAIIYAIGWGPTLTVGYLFVLARVLESGGSRVWRPAWIWSTVGVALGEIAIAVNLVPTYVPAPYVHGLACLGVLGNLFVMRLLGTTTEENERALAARDHATEDLRSTFSLMSATLESTADGILVVDREGRMTLSNRRFGEMWQLPPDIVASRDDAVALDFVSRQLVHPEAFEAKVHELYDQPGAESNDTLEFTDGRIFERHSRPQRVDGEIVGQRLELPRRHRAQPAARPTVTPGVPRRRSQAWRTGRCCATGSSTRSHAHGVRAAWSWCCSVTSTASSSSTTRSGTTTATSCSPRSRSASSTRCATATLRLVSAVTSSPSCSTTRRATTRSRSHSVCSTRCASRSRSRVATSSSRASIGIADNGDDALDADELLCRADIAMYAAKGRGRDRCEVFQTSMQTELTARHELHGDLRRAISSGELELHYQPLVDLPTATIESFEALVRWRHPRRGLVSPDEFIPVAEDTGLIVEIGRYVLREACRQIMEWRGLPGGRDIGIGVNVSSHQLYDDTFVADVEAALCDSGLPAESLVLELTESALLTDSVHVQQRLAALKQLGVRIAIDDFGTGYSSLAYLRTFPIDFLKIDRSFVNEMSEDDDQGAVMVRSIISIGHNLRLDVIAEGIEDVEQLAALREAGCNSGQGFLFARPTHPDDVPHLLASQTPQTSPAARTAHT